jgi:ATP-dependent DNA helicase RecG
VTTMDTLIAKSVARSKPAVLAELERAFGIRTVGDLLRHYPRRYAEWGQFTEIGSLRAGEEVTILAEVVDVKEARVSLKGRPGSIIKVTVRDGSGETMTLSFFGGVTSGGRVKSPVAGLKRGSLALFAGTVTRFRDKVQLDHPGVHRLDDPADADDMLSSMLPLYPATRTVRSWDIGQAVRTLLDVVPIEDPMPSAIRAQRNLLDLATALRFIHRPADYAQVEVARKRLKWDEAFAVQVALVQRKLRADAAPATPRPGRDGALLSTFDSSLPYELTDGQLAVGEQIAADLGRTHPMHRLLQGEVGSGKTVCALRAMLQVVDAGGQAALLAPTEVLAAQHHRSIRELLGPLGRAGELDSASEATAVVLVTGSQGAAVRRQAAAEVASGAVGIVIGTHALLYEGVSFRDLGLVVVDEQHRFGVEQRDTLRARAGGTPPHVLVMTATPIPRTVAMTVFGDLETSELTELPRGRSPIATHVVPTAEKPAHFDRAWQRLREEVAKGHQAYVVCPRIGGDRSDDDAESTMDDGPATQSTVDGGSTAETPRRPPLAVLDVAPMLQEAQLAGLRMGVLHGRLPGDEKDAVMRAFAAGRLDVLVATTVIEVGVDVPNATMMVVLDADRFGVSQLHQLRGRVGRGSAPGLCLLVTGAPAESLARERLDAVASTVDGFELARLDLELRREGDVLGEAQSGGSRHLRLLSLARDEALIGEARREAIGLLDGDPELRDHPALAAAVQAMVDERSAQFLEKG